MGTDGSPSDFSHLSQYTFNNRLLSRTLWPYLRNKTVYILSGQLRISIIFIISGCLGQEYFLYWSVEEITVIDTNSTVGNSDHSDERLMMTTIIKMDSRIV